MQIFTGNILLDLISIFIIIFAAIYAYFQWIYRTWERKNIPYFKPRFPSGNLIFLREPVPIGVDVCNVVEKAKKNGWNYFGLFMGGRPFFVPLDLEVIKYILTKDFNHFTDRGVYSNERDDPLSDHLFAIGGDRWRHLRSKLTPTFTSGKMKGMFQTLVDCGLLLEQTLNQLDSKEAIDIKHVLVCFSIDIIGSCAFGLECNSFKDSDSDFIKYGRKLFIRNKYQQFLSMLAESFPKLMKAFHFKIIPTDISSFFFDVVMKTVDYREKNNYSRNDFLQMLIDMKDKNTQPSENKSNESTLTMNEIVAQSLLFFLAGFETSSSAMTFALYELSIHPEIQEKVREELFRVLKKYDNKMCYDSLKELEYMQQVIDETLRKYPALFFITRQCVQDYTIPDSDIILEKGTNVLIPIKNIHYDTEVYENPEEFDPERFNPENKKRRHQYAHIPFGEGPRICIGMRFGLMQSKVGLSTVLRKFRVKLNSKTKTPLVMDPNSILAAIKGGLWLDLEKI